MKQHTLNNLQQNVPNKLIKYLMHLPYQSNDELSPLHASNPFLYQNIKSQNQNR